MRAVALRVKKCGECAVGDAHHHDQCGERPERVRVVGRAERAAALESRTKTESLDHRGGNRESHECEPRDRGQDEARAQRRKRQPDQDCETKCNPRRLRIEDESARPEIRRDEQRSQEPEDRQLRDERPMHTQLVGER